MTVAEFPRMLARHLKLRKEAMDGGVETSPACPDRKTTLSNKAG